MIKLLRRRSPSFAVASLKEKTSLFISCFFVAVVIQPIHAKEVTEIHSVQELNRSARTVKEWFAQIEQQNPPAPNNPPSVPPNLGGKQGGEVVQVTSVKANPTSSGVEVILQTLKGQQLQVVNRSNGNNFIADIANAQLRLASGNAFTFRSTPTTVVLLTVIIRPMVVRERVKLLLQSAVLNMKRASRLIF